MTDAAAALARLKMLAVLGARISWEVPHARQRAQERNVPVFVAERILRNPAAVRITLGEDGSERWRASGLDPDERPVDVVVVVTAEEVIRVITVIRTDE